MNAAVPQTPEISSRDRLVTTLFFALIVHAIIILGISFAPDKPGGSSTLEVTLVQTRSATPPDHADYIAQADQRGEGNTRELVRPASPLSMPSAVNNPGLPDAEDLANRTGRNASTRDSKGSNPERAANRDAAVTTRTDTGLYANAQAAPAPQDSGSRVLVARLLTQGDDALMPTDDPVQLPEATSPDPRETFVSINARASRYAPYLDSWRRKVEHIGNLNFPAAIRERHLSGSLALEVALNADGSIRSLTLRKPSRYKILDESALRIVKLAAPFEPFPAVFRKDTDVLRFVYLWRFNAGRVDTRHGGVRTAP
ncbi:MAG TPA: TonB family protein [Gammaproteobacteria bacterium]|nr:TonB family protein [Gammaproteobacteria bacterium]